MNEFGKIEVGIYRKATHSSKYLDFHLHSPAQGKRALVNILMVGAVDRLNGQSEERPVSNDVKADGFPKNFINSV